MTSDTANLRSNVIKDLGNGLVLRIATPDDAEALADFHAWQQTDHPGEQEMGVKVWVLDQMSGHHPTFKATDYMLVEDTAGGKIASSMCLISQTWLYGGIPIRMGQPEIVSTAPEYRRRGLVREQFAAIHAWSVERGELMQAITGIPWYYRQFGYEMALPMSGGRLGYTPHVPRLPEGQTEPYSLRPATEADIPLLQQIEAQMSRRCMVVAARTEADWRYELNGHSAGSLMKNQLRVIETAQGEATGLLGHRSAVWGTTLHAFIFELMPGRSWGAITPAVVRYLAATGKEYAARDGGEWYAFGLMLGTEHPAYSVATDMAPRLARPYAWYVRVPDLCAFLLRVAPVLEERMSRSVVVNHTGEIKLNFYRTGITLSFEAGKLTRVENWRPGPGEDGDAAFPDLTFFQMLFGQHTLEELEAAFPDCSVRSVGNPATRALLNAIFPKQPSAVWAVN